VEKGQVRGKNVGIEEKIEKRGKPGKSGEGPRGKCQREGKRRWGKGGCISERRRLGRQKEEEIPGENASESEGPKFRRGSPDKKSTLEVQGRFLKKEIPAPGDTRVTRN